MNESLSSQDLSLGSVGSDFSQLPQKSAIDQALLELSESKSKWLTIALAEKINLLK